MADDQRVYSDEEFALILQQAAELASKAEQTGTSSSSGLTLAEMKAAAAQAGFDPAIVERAAHMLAAKVHETPLERLLGGPLQHKQEVRLPIELNAKRAAMLLSAVRINASLAGTTDVGHSSAVGVTWHDGGPIEALGVTARPEKDGTAVSVSVDRRGTLLITGAFSSMALVMALLFSAHALYPESPAYGITGAILSVGGVFAAARAYWAASTRRLRERIGGVVESVSQTLGQAEAEATRKLDAPSE